MWYDVAITVANTYTEASPLETRIKVTHGVITRVSFRPRPGHSAVCHARVYYHDLQIAPVDRNQDLHGDTFPIEWDDYLEVFTPPYEIVVRSWNLGTYEHTFDLGFALIPEEIAAPPTGILAGLKKLFGLLGVR